MNELEAALVDITGFLTEAGIPYMVIGGYANLHWGRPRLTQDLDVTMRISEDDWPAFVARLSRRYTVLPSEPLEFLRQTRVLPIVTPTQVRVDLVVAGLPYEEQAMARSREVIVGAHAVRVCAPEDLVLHKLVSERSRDLEDVEGIIVRQASALDRDYLDPWVERLAAGLERPAISDFYRTCLRKAGLRPV